MKILKNAKLNQKGFTLIELMIVVGIIGILVAIAAPNFSRYQSKARQSEAKIALAAIYGAEKAFYSEYAAYMGSMDAIGYSPEGQKRFYIVGWSGAPGAVMGYAGGSGNVSWTNVNNSFGGCGGTITAQAPVTAADAQTFNANAAGCIRQTANLHDAWSINDIKVLSNVIIGL